MITKKHFRPTFFRWITNKVYCATNKTRAYFADSLATFSYLALVFFIKINNAFGADVNLESQIAKVGTLFDKVKVVGITAATVVACIYGIVKGSLQIFIVAMVSGIAAGLYLEWVKGGMLFGASL